MGRTANHSIKGLVDQRKITVTAGKMITHGRFGKDTEGKMEIKVETDKILPEVKQEKSK